MSSSCPALPPRRRGVILVIGLALQSLALVHHVLPAWAQAGETASDLKRPSYQIRRFDED